MPSEQIDFIVQMLENQPIYTLEEAPAIRARMERGSELFPLPAGMTRESVTVAGVPAEWIKTSSASDRRVLLYLHGGGYIAGSPTSHRHIVAWLAEAAAANCLSAAYRLAPEHPFPAALEDALAVYRWLRSQGFKAEEIAIAGDSSGGGLSLATLLTLRDAGEPMPAAAVLLSPWVDMELAGDTMDSKAPVDPVVQRAILQKMADSYLAGRDRRTPAASPLYSDLHGLPPLLIHVGTNETLLDDARRLAARAREAEVDVTLEEWDGMIHVFQSFSGFLPEGKESIQKIGNFLHRQWQRERTRSTGSETEPRTSGKRNNNNKTTRRTMQNTLQRRRVAVKAPQEVVSYGSLPGHPMFPLVIKPNSEDFDLPAWISANRDDLNRKLLHHGGLLFQGFNVDTVEKFQHVAKSFDPVLLPYTERSSPRDALSRKDNTYTATTYPPREDIAMHNANSFAHEWPMRIRFCCVKKSRVGGRTPICDTREVLRQIPKDVREVFRTRKLKYLRNYHRNLAVSWQDTFNTDSKEEVNAYCREAGIEFEWVSDDHLRTRAVREAIFNHPLTGDDVWFNQAHIFHISGMTAEQRKVIESSFAPEDYPRDCYFGDGEPIPDQLMDEVRNAFDRATVGFDWEEGDWMMLDNMLASHARTPFEGERLIAVNFSETFVYGPTSL
ncbi:MAG: alpha/beta hydrolase fold domain-containing protein [Proteobacteria bacterium]|nr:alpha/beta hydrolase fold domain-containing protein [Pseudomonadota bacterium]